MIPTTSDLSAAVAADGEARLLARHWTGGLRLVIGNDVTGFTTVDGAVLPGVPEPGPGVITLTGSADVWAPMVQATPPPFAAISVLVARGEAGIDRGETDSLTWWQYAPVVERVCELMRAAGGVRAAPSPADAGPTPRHDSPVGRYVHIDIDDHDHRIYYEEAGTGIPLLLQHTAGAHGTQWRHLFEMPEITNHFRLIAYDLPFHGKSIPPVGKRWWEEEYQLKGAFLRQIPVGIATALALDNPVFMGCSVGGLLALDLALHHPDVFRAVISLEGSLNITGNVDELQGFWHPQVSNTTKARSMEELCAPTSPEAYVKEVSQVYSAGWPPVFIGDLWYYMHDYDLRDRAHEIDTTQVGVHILNGEYDFSGHVSGGIAAHQAIAGSTHTTMHGMGHFPMTENPVDFARYLMPILDSIAD